MGIKSIYNSMSLAPNQTPTLALAPKAPGASPLTALDQGWRSFDLQAWVTIRANASGPSPWPAVLSVTQEDSGWVDLQRFADAGFWVEVSEVTQPTGGKVLLTIESSPTLDETLFKPACQPVEIAPTTDPTTSGTIPILVRTARTPTTVPLSRWTRWRLSVSAGATGPWDATFRIRGAGGRSSFILPNQLSGCLLWLRADLGITLDPSGNVGRWADQSGRGNDAVQSSVSNQPRYNVLAHPPIGGQQVVFWDSTGSGTRRFMPLTHSLGSPSALHIFLVNRRLTATEFDPSLTGLWQLGTSASLSHYPWSGDQHIYDDGGGTTRYDCGSAVSPISLGAPHVYEVQNKAGSWANFLSGRPQFTSATNVVGTGAASPVIGGTGSFGPWYQGDWAELFIYNRILTPNERSLLVNYMNGRYGLGAV